MTRGFRIDRQPPIDREQSRSATLRQQGCGALTSTQDMRARAIGCGFPSTQLPCRTRPYFNTHQANSARSATDRRGRLDRQEAWLDHECTISTLRAHYRTALSEAPRSRFTGRCNKVWEIEWDDLSMPASENRFQLYDM